MKAYFLTGKKNRKDVPAKLAAAFEVLFVPSSAKASVSGKDRDRYAAKVLEQLPAVLTAGGGNPDTLVIETEVTRGTGDAAKQYPAVIVVDVAKMPDLLKGIFDANTGMEEARARATVAEQVYKSARHISIDGYEAGKRGRRAGSQEIDLGLA